LLIGQCHHHLDDRLRSVAPRYDLDAARRADGVTIASPMKPCMNELRGRS
jgi:hypothetical protein